MAEVLESRGRQIHFAKRYSRKDGRTIWIEVSSALVYGDNGEPSHFITHLLDVTERKLAEIALQGERERLAVTLRCIGDGVITTDTEGNVEIVNEAAEALTGWTQGEALGHPITEIFRIVNDITGMPGDNPVEHVLRDGGPVELEGHIVLVARDGTRRKIADSGAPIRDTKGVTTGIVLVFRDVTEKQRLLDAAQRAQRLESLGVLAGGIAHDFNNLLAGIYGNIELARLSSTREEMGECLEGTLGTLERARGLTKQLLTFSKGGAPVPRSGNLDSFLRDTVKFAVSGSDAAVSYDISDDLWHCEFDAGQLSQVIDNLVINALQAMPNGGVITVAASNLEVADKQFPGLPGGRYVAITITDTGVGMSADVASRIFDPFFTTKRLGNGLGLAIVHSIVSQHGGTVEVESQPGAGTSFHVILPASTGPAAATEPSPAIRAGTGRILIMDDERALRSLFESMVGELGYEAVSSADGEEALRMFVEARRAGRPFRAVILDLTVPGGMGGLETAAEMRRVDPAIPIFVASGYVSGSIMADPGAHGLAGSIRKPFTLGELSAVLAPLADPRPAEQPLPDEA